MRSQGFLYMPDYPLVHVYITMDNHNLFMSKSAIAAAKSSIAMSVYQTVSDFSGFFDSWGQGHEAMRDQPSSDPGT